MAGPLVPHVGFEVSELSLGDEPSMYTGRMTSPSTEAAASGGAPVPGFRWAGDRAAAGPAAEDARPVDSIRIFFE